MDKDRFPHVFLHDPSDRSFYHYFYHQNTGTVLEQQIDRGESGAEHVVFVTDKEIWSIHYFYRDPFNKGLLVTVSNVLDGKMIKQFVFDASKVRNTGWDLVGGQSSNGRILFTYLSDSQKKQREYVLLDGVEDLARLADNLKVYGHPKGDGFLQSIAKEDREKLIQDLVSSYQKELRNLILNYSIGTQYVWWEAFVESPSVGSDEITPYEPKYQFSDALMSSFSIEGHFYSFNFGIEAVTTSVDEKIEDSSSDETKQLNRWKGKLGWEKIFFDFDVQLETEQTTTTVLFEDHSDQVPTQTFSLSFKETKLSLLTFKRHHFGLISQTYNFIQPIYVFQAPKGSTEFLLESQALGEVEVSNWLLHYGYSTIDYLNKYETDFQDWFIDYEFQVGTSSVSFNKELQSVGDNTPSFDRGRADGVQLEFGWISYRRWEFLNQIGGAIKLSYRGDYFSVGDFDRTYLNEGDVDRPEDRHTNSTDETKTVFQRAELRHGPIFLISLIY